jgi:hypothetical protein
MLSESGLLNPLLFYASNFILWHRGFAQQTVGPRITPFNKREDGQAPVGWDEHVYLRHNIIVIGDSAHDASVCPPDDNVILRIGIVSDPDPDEERVRIVRMLQHFDIVVSGEMAIETIWVLIQSVVGEVDICTEPLL